MSDESELARLRADLKVLDEIRARYDKDADFTTLVNNMRDRIEADPWREAKVLLDHWSRLDETEHPRVLDLVNFFDHLTAENARLTARVAELEAENATREELEDDYYNASEAAKQAYGHGRKRLADMQPPFEGPIVGFDPVLEPNRVLATAVEALAIRRLAAQTRDRLTTLCNNAKPYPLKKGCEA